MIHHIRIQGFKSCEDVSVNLEPVTVLIGKSGSGKSNFMDAIRFLRDFLTSRNPGPAIGAVNGNWVNEFSSSPAAVSFSVVFSTGESQERFEYDLKLIVGHPGANPVIKEERLTLANAMLFHQMDGAWSRPPTGANAPAPSGNLMLGGITGLNDSTMAHAMLTSGIGCYSFSDRVLLTSTLDKSHQGLKDDASNFVSAFDDLQANLKRMNSIRNIKSSLSKLKPNLNSIDLEMPGRERIVLMMENEGIRHLFLVSQESEGFRRLLACLLALYQTPSKQTLLFDEPEKGIYPAALPLLAEEFMACAASGRGQVILTTHSPQFLDHFKPEQIRVVEMNGYGTQIGPVSSEQMEALHEHFLRPGELLTVDQARMEQPAAAD